MSQLGQFDLHLLDQLGQFDLLLLYHSQVPFPENILRFHLHFHLHFPRYLSTPNSPPSSPALARGLFPLDQTHQQNPIPQIPRGPLPSFDSCSIAEPNGTIFSRCEPCGMVSAMSCFIYAIYWWFGNAALAQPCCYRMKNHPVIIQLTRTIQNDAEYRTTCSPRPDSPPDLRSEPSMVRLGRTGAYDLHVILSPPELLRDIRRRDQGSTA